MHGYVVYMKDTSKNENHVTTNIRTHKLPVSGEKL